MQEWPVGGRPVPRPARPSGDSAYERFVRTAVYFGAPVRGHHHRTYAVRPFTRSMARLAGGAADEPVAVRLRLPDAPPVAIRTWADEAGVLAAVGSVLPHVPHYIAGRGDTAIHSHVDGVPLSGVCPDGHPVDPPLIGALTGLLAGLGRVRRDALPPLPQGWPRPEAGDSRAFLRTLAQLTERRIRQANWPEFGGLFTSLGIPDDAVLRYAERAPALTRRPYGLLHTDLHRDNVIVPRHGDVPLVAVDWEFASFGDPLHDLAAHLVRMRYPDAQWREVTTAWAAATTAVRPRAVEGLERDLPHYVAFERARSAYPAVVRAARSLGASFDQKALDEATATVHRALADAAEPLRLARVPDVEEIERLLFRWAACGGRREGAGPRPAASWIRHRPDPRVPARGDFPQRCVQDALAAEGAAPAEHVFKGTAHLNTVVRVDNADFPVVVVRRRASSVAQPERRFLSEHAVLGAIERSGAPVRAPRVLALGVSDLLGDRQDPFAVHSYEGPAGTCRPPSHPVNGLLPHEADDVVDQLCALTRVDHAGLDPAAEGVDFFRWLSAELARLVHDLPRTTQQLARELGLPDGYRLREILDQYRVAPRAPALLHGDLNPWNLVRRDGTITVIDWEMAMIGDPLYDLVRHLHLTPTRPEIRRRMFERWSGRLPERHTTGWADDWRVYRWIEIVRSAYVDLDRLVTGAGLDAPNVQRAVDSYAMTLRAATALLGLSVGSTTNPYLARAFPGKGGRGRTGAARPRPAGTGAGG
ncbi:phosphotransferase [Streptomyces sp. NPDC002004]